MQGADGIRPQGSPEVTMNDKFRRFTEIGRQRQGLRDDLSKFTSSGLTEIYMKNIGERLNEMAVLAVEMLGRAASPKELGKIADQLEAILKIVTDGKEPDVVGNFWRAVSLFQGFSGPAADSQKVDDVAGDVKRGVEAL
ncbi:MAG: hypothetical protein WCT53_04420 [Candidatus Gracilibacteria bacterium]|jgi:hypothetical protein